MSEGQAKRVSSRIVVIAKAAVAGRVKTRLTKPGPNGEPALTPEQAAAVHAAMLDCVLTRVRRVLLTEARVPEVELFLAMDDPAAAPETARGWTVIAQGEGHLGERMARVGGGGGVVFLGVDSPDAPVLGLQEAEWTALGVGPGGRRGFALAAAGPVDDGGYWTLAMSRPMPPLLRGIDWGTEVVLEQTFAAAQAAGLAFRALPHRWHDVDNGADLAALRERLARADAAEEPELIKLRHRLDAV